jgi:arylsulfatase A-like enzyme
VVAFAAIGHIDLTKVWPNNFAKTLRERKGYTTALFGKCMNNNCGPNPAASGMNLHQMGAFDRWFEGVGYQNLVFYDNEAAGCPGWPWPEDKCKTPTNPSTVGAGYLTSELGNRTITWLKKISAEPERRPWFVYYATHSPHGPATPAEWYKDACPGVQSPRSHPNFNYSGHKRTDCSIYPPGSASFGGNGTREWWNNTDFPELTSCQPGFTDAQITNIDAEARHRCQTLLSVDDTYTQIVAAVEELGQLDNTFILVTSDHGYNLGNHMLATAKMQIYDHALRIPMVFAGLFRRGPSVIMPPAFSFI